MELSIIIVHYRAKKELWACLRSIERSKPDMAYEIIVVDNDEEKIIEKELKQKFPRVLYVSAKGNIGFGAGNNLGAQKAKGELLFFLNPDTEVLQGTLAELVLFVKANTGVGAVAPLLLDEDNKAYQQGSLELTPMRGVVALSFINKLFPNNPISKAYFLQDWNKKETKKVDTVPGTAFMLKKDIFEKVRGFDERLFLYFEEDDLCRRVRKLDLQNYIYPQAKVVHLGGISSRGMKGLTKIFEKSRFLYFKKHFGLPQAFFVELFLRLRKNMLS